MLQERSMKINIYGKGKKQNNTIRKQISILTQKIKKLKKKTYILSLDGLVSKVLQQFLKILTIIDNSNLYDWGYNQSVIETMKAGVIHIENYEFSNVSRF